MLATSTAQTRKPQVLTSLLAIVAKGQCCKLSCLAADLLHMYTIADFKASLGRRPCSPAIAMGQYTGCSTPSWQLVRQAIKVCWQRWSCNTVCESPTVYGPSKVGYAQKGMYYWTQLQDHCQYHCHFSQISDLHVLRRVKDGSSLSLRQNLV